MTTTVEVSEDTTILTKKVCSECGADDEGLTYLDHAGKVFCRNCYHEFLSACAHCGEVFYKDRMTGVDSKLYCQDCLDGHFRFCEGCETFIAENRSCYSELDGRDYCEDCFSERVVYCSTCEHQTDAETCYSDDDGNEYCESCWDCRGDGPSGYLELTGSSFKICRSPRKYGIEIEAMMEEGSDHLPIENRGQWKQVPDGSLGDSGREYVSPILQGDEGFIEIRKFTGVLNDWGYYTDGHCGLHVHIDGRDLVSMDIKKLLKITRYFEPVLYAMLPDSRREGSYSVPLERLPKSRLRIAATTEEALKKMWYGPRGCNNSDLNSKYHHSRYFGLNIHSWFYRRSLEFRYHSGTLNPSKITNFIVICQTLVDKAKSLSSFRIPRECAFTKRVNHFLAFLGLPNDLADYIHRRIEKFHPSLLVNPAV